jgi:hypothetical protein
VITMKKIDWDAIWEAVKEPLREIVMAIIPFALDRLSVLPDFWAVILYLVLRGIDQYLHGEAKAGVAGGLTKF